MNLDSALQTFYAEASELLEVMESALLLMDGGAEDADTLNEIFRAAHTIKGSAGIFGLDHIVEFTHVVENVLDRARSNDISLDKELINVLFKCRDHINHLVQCAPEDFSADESLQQAGDSILGLLSRWATDTPQRHVDKEEISTNEVDGVTTDGCWHISLRLTLDCLRNGMDPLSFIGFLNTLGDIRYIETITDGLPDISEFDPESLYLAYEIALYSDADRDTIENTFAFVAEDSDIKILPPDSKVEQYIELINSLPEENERLGQILIRCGALTEESLERILNQQSRSSVETGGSKKLGELLVEQSKIPERVVDVALNKQKTNKERSGANAPKFIRVDADQLDHLINIIGEVVISRQRVDVLSQQTQSETLIEAVESLSAYTEELRDTALSLRMVPIGDTFQRFRRIVRDTAQELGKDIELVISGAETELDRLMVEKLTDPLTHIVRNAIDHGIESMEARREAGKSETGHLSLSAYQDAGHIVIEINDDGGGLNKQRILEKAVSKDIIPEGTVLPDHDLFLLIFHPGFSTSEAVTNLSGRGVGMDVVKRNVEALQGSIEIDSTDGEGSTFKIRLPLTLAIMDGFHVESKGAHFVIPQATVIECMDIADYEQKDERQCFNLRGDMIPFLRLNNVFSLTSGEDVGSDEILMSNKIKEKMVVVQMGDSRAGIVVDELHGEIQTVVKPLGPIFQPLKGIGGSSLLGGGEIAFILDIQQLIEMAVHHEHNTTSA